MEEKFPSSLTIVYVVAGSFLAYLFLSDFERGNEILRIIPVIFVLGVLSLLVIIWDRKTTFLQLSQSHFTNSGYRSFGKDTIQISKIKYITRIPQTALPFVGPSLMVIYSTLDDGHIAHCYVREFSYEELVLKQFLTRIKDLNPNIELDTEYQEFLQDNRELRTKTSNTVQSVEQKLKDKGEVW